MSSLFGGIDFGILPGLGGLGTEGVDTTEPGSASNNSQASTSTPASSNPAQSAIDSITKSIQDAVNSGVTTASTGVQTASDNLSKGISSQIAGIENSVEGGMRSLGIYVILGILLVFGIYTIVKG